MWKCKLLMIFCDIRIICEHGQLQGQLNHNKSTNFASSSIISDLIWRYIFYLVLKILILKK